ncbi:MAG TPA: MsnO8 family LLM class oxidoreductase [Kaistia sp.]|nr:MsnO8 family LLM class oxidoreductase [Kaistia sp.]
MTYVVGLLDKSPIAKDETAAAALARTVRLAQLAEREGFSRFWIAEHHDTADLASPAPEVVIPYVLAATSGIRVGSGGVMLQHYSPYKVAESFNTLAALAPGRVDLGIGKAPGGLPFSTRELQSERADGSHADFEAKLAALTLFLDDAQGADRARATPRPLEPPKRFLLGASVDSATLAARQGWTFVFARHLNGDEALLEAALDAYRQVGGRDPIVAVAAIVGKDRQKAAELGEAFRPIKVHVEGRQSVTVGTEEQAREYARQAGVADFRTTAAKPSLIAGDGADLVRELDRLGARFGIGEFIVDLFNAGDSRLEAAELIARARAASRATVAA